MINPNKIIKNIIGVTSTARKRQKVRVMKPLGRLKQAGRRKLRQSNQLKNYILKPNNVRKFKSILEAMKKKALKENKSNVCETLDTWDKIVKKFPNMHQQNFLVGLVEYGPYGGSEKSIEGYTNDFEYLYFGHHIDNYINNVKDIDEEDHNYFNWNYPWGWDTFMYENDLYVIGMDNEEPNEPTIYFFSLNHNKEKMLNAMKYGMKKFYG